MAADLLMIFEPHLAREAWLVITSSFNAVPGSAGSFLSRGSAMLPGIAIKISGELEMSHHKPWFLKSKKLGDYSHLRWKDFNELREIVTQAVEEEFHKHSHINWKRIKDAVLTALCRLAMDHNCEPKLNAEGGDICFYHLKKPVFALRIGNYARHRVEDLLEGKALYRGIIDIVPTIRPSIPNDLSHKDELRALLKQSLEGPMKVFYYLLPTIKAGKWKKKEAFDLLDIIGTLKEHPGSSGRFVQHTLNFNPNKTFRLLGWLKSRRILHRKGASRSSGWYLNWD